MDVHIENFRGILYYTVSFETGMNALVGNSGAGKSTVLAAVRWCLFGEPRIGIAPKRAAKTKFDTLVLVKFHSLDLVVQRSNGKSAQYVWLNNTPVHPDVIQSIFGENVDLFDSRSYIAQKSMNLIFRTRNKLDSELMDKLLYPFGDIPPAACIAETEKRRTNSITKRSELIAKRDRFADLMNRIPQVTESLLCAAQPPRNYTAAEISTQISVLRMLSQFEDDVKRLSMELSVVLSVQHENVDELRKQMDSVKHTPESYISETLGAWMENAIFLERETQIEKLRLCTPKWLLDEIDSLPGKITHNETFLRLMTQYNSQMSEYTKNVAKQIQLQEACNAEIVKLKNALDLPPPTDVEDFNSSPSARPTCPTVTNGQITCPKCSEKLVIANGAVCTISDYNDAIVAQKAWDAKFVLHANYTKQMKERAAIESRLRMLESTKHPVIDEPQKPDIEKLVIAKYDVNWVKSRTADLSKFAAMPNVSSCNNTVFEKKNFLATCTTKDVLFRKLNAAIEHATQVNKLRATMEGIESSIGRITEGIRDTSGILIPVEVMQYAANWYANFENSRLLDETKKSYTDAVELLRAEETRIQQYTDILAHIGSRRTAYVQSVLQSVSDAVTRIASVLMDKTLELQLSVNDVNLVRTVSSTTFNYNIIYDGNPVDMDSVSGGEQDRISIAITCAFAIAQKSPIVMFDETLSSIDERKVPEVTAAIKELLPGKIVIIVAHALNTGEFDNIITKV